MAGIGIPPGLRVEALPRSVKNKMARKAGKMAESGAGVVGWVAGRLGAGGGLPDKRVGEPVCWSVRR